MIKCRPTGRHYVGQSLQVSRRLRTHRRELEGNNHVNKRLQRAWNKYGPECFSFAQILVCRPEDLTMYEQHITDMYRPTGVYNLGQAVDAPNRGRAWSASTRKKMSIGHRRARKDPVIGPKMAAATRKAVQQPEYREKMSQVIAARWANPKFRDSLVASGYSARLSAAVRKSASTEEGHRRRVSAAHKQWEDEGRHERQSAILKKTLSTPHHRARMQHNNQIMWADPAHRAQITAKAAARNADPDFRRDFQVAIKRGWEDADERRAKASARMKEMRARQIAAKHACSNEAPAP